MNWIEELKLGKSSLFNQIEKLFTFCMQTAVIPFKWNIALDILLHKYGHTT